MFLLFSINNEWCKSFDTIEHVNIAIINFIEDNEDISDYKLIDISNAKKVEIKVNWLG